jgi:DNA-binding SARP family transcriptional activator
MTLAVKYGKTSIDYNVLSLSVIGLGAMLTLHVRLLGEFSLTYGGEVVQAVGTMRLQSLLAHLVLHRSTPESRRHLAFTLWPDSNESQARTNLRRELHNLRQALPAADQFLSVETQTLQWRSDAPFTLDVGDFEQAVSTAH